MEEVRLYDNTKFNPVDGKPPEGTNARKVFDCFQELIELQAAGKPIYIKFVSGDRKGSIARFVVDRHTEDRYNECKKGDPVLEAKIRWAYRSYYGSEDTPTHELQVYGRGIARWDGRQNKVQVSLSYGEVVYLREYEGPTVWQKFDAKAAKEELLKDPKQKDIDGNELKIGDRVLFVNIRYGSGAELDRGKIKNFEASVDSRSHTIRTIVENDDGVISTIEKPERLIMLWPVSIDT